MNVNELELKKFEFDQKVKLEELEIKKKELELKLQEQKGKRFTTPLVLSIIGGLITLITGIVLKYLDSNAVIRLEDKKFQSSLLLKATDAKTYEEFSGMIVALQENGLLDLDSSKVANFRKKRFIEENTARLSTADSSATSNPGLYWAIVAVKSLTEEAAKSKKMKIENEGFKEVGVWSKDNAYAICIGKYSSNVEALGDLFDTREKINNTARTVRMDTWCPDHLYDSSRGIYLCR